MSKTGRSLMIALLSVSLLAPGFAEAGRVGGGRSTGMQRSQITRSAPVRPQQAVPPQTAPAPQQAQPQRSGPGWGGVAAGAAAGAVGGYMLGRAMDNTAPASGVAAQSQPAAPSVPWGMILLLGGLAVLGAMMFLRRRPQAASPYVPAGVPAGLDAQQDRKVYRVGEGMNMAAAPVSSMTRLPDGTETAAFLRQARASFMHIQSLNSPEQVEEVRRYLTPDLFEALKAEIAANRDLAEFPELNVDLLDAAVEGNNTIASVRFSGRVSESLHAPAAPFAEIWHFMRPVSGDPRWVVAGIQQE